MGALWGQDSVRRGTKWARAGSGGGLIVGGGG